MQRNYGYFLITLWNVSLLNFMPIMNILIETVLWILIIQGFVIVHYFVIVKKNMSPVHFINLTIAFTLAIVITYFLHFDTWWFRILNMIYLGLIYWILFAIELNKSRNLKWDYLGIDKDPEEDSTIDKIERWFIKKAKTSAGAVLFAKVCLMLLCLFILLDLPNPWE